jgi:hypothetical protein
MKRTLTIVILLTVISCSPKYTASFQNHNRSNGETKQVTDQIIDRENEIVFATEEAQSSSLNNDVPDETLTASTANQQPIEIKINQPEILTTEVKLLSRAEKQSLKKQIKSEVKSSKQEIKTEKRGKKSWNIFAYSGFGLSLIAMTVGIAFPPLLILLIPSTIFSVLGLWSKKKGWAIAGLLVPVVIGSLILIILAAAGWSG